MTWDYFIQMNQNTDKDEEKPLFSQEIVDGSREGSMF